MFTALVSLFTDRTIRNDAAMTGEISLRGLVLPVGGIKEKVVAALRAGIRTVLLPARNKRDFEDIPKDARNRQIGRAHVELQSLMRISYAVFCLKKKKHQ